MPDDAAWMFANVTVGDPIVVSGGKWNVDPGNGFGDWNLDWSAWQHLSATA